MIFKGVLFVFILFTGIVLSKEIEERKQKLCGPVLIQALETICKSGYSLRQKKSARNPIEDEYDLNDWSYRTNYLRQRRFDVVTECCRNPCSFDTLKLYCLE